MTEQAAKPDAVQQAADPGAQRVASVYAKAFLAAAVKAGAADAALNELTEIETQVLERFPRLVSILASGFIHAEEKQKIVDRVFEGKVSLLVLNFLRVLAEHERLELLREILRSRASSMPNYKVWCALRSRPPRRLPRNWPKRSNSSCVARLAESRCWCRASNPE